MARRVCLWIRVQLIHELPAFTNVCNQHEENVGEYIYIYCLETTMYIDVIKLSIQCYITNYLKLETCTRVPFDSYVFTVHSRYIRRLPSALMAGGG